MLGSPPDDPMSIFDNGKLRPGLYNVQNLTSGTYLEVWESSKEVCCRPGTVLAPQHAVWEFQASGSGYIIKKAERGMPDQYCNSMGGFIFGFGSPVSATAYPASWRVEIVEDIKYRGFGYVRIFWDRTNRSLGLNWWGSSNDGTTVRLYENILPAPWRIWKLIPVHFDGHSTARGEEEHQPPPKYIQGGNSGEGITQSIRQGSV